MRYVIGWSTFKAKRNTFEAEQNVSPLEAEQNVSALEAEQNVSPLEAECVASGRGRG